MASVQSKHTVGLDAAQRSRSRCDLCCMRVQCLRMCTRWAYTTLNGACSLGGRKRRSCWAGIQKVTRASAVRRNIVESRSATKLPPVGLQGDQLGIHLSRKGSSCTRETCLRRPVPFDTLAPGSIFGILCMQFSWLLQIPHSSACCSNVYC